MAEPKKKLTRARRGWRRSQQGRISLTLIHCSHCGKLIPPHRVCPNCGFYKKREVIPPKEKKKKK